MTDPTISQTEPVAPYEAIAPLPAKSPRLGTIALIVALGVFVLSMVTSVLVGIAAAPFANTDNGVSYYTNLGSSNPAEVAVSAASMAHVLIGSLLGTTALVLGIVATASGRGRKFGIAAMIIAFLAPGISVVTFFIVMVDTIAR